MKPRNIANGLADTYKTRNPFLLCENLDVHVLIHQLKEIRGYYACVDNINVIVLAADLPPHVNEYVCGHELGHMLLHKGLNRVFMDSRTFLVPDRFENEADEFAAALLYSEPKDFSEKGLSDWELAECLNVATCNVYSRMIELGMYI